MTAASETQGRRDPLAADLDIPVADLLFTHEAEMAEYACQDCTRCTRSGLMTVLRGAAAVATLGVSEIGIAASDFVRRTCPGCDHPIDEHTVARHLFSSSASVQSMSDAQPNVRARPARCRHPRFVRTREGNGHCPDCGDIWDAHGHRWDRYGRFLR